MKKWNKGTSINEITAHGVKDVCRPKIKLGFNDVIRIFDFVDNDTTNKQ